MINTWRAQLRSAGRNEIGGVLFGEQLAEGDFRIIEATRQRFGGNAVTFNRQGGKARSDIRAFHRSFGGDGARFNYLGEWHSHPSAPAHPSPQDEITMYQLLAEQQNAVNFLVLAIIRLASEERLELGAMTYLASGHKLRCDVMIEEVSGDND